MQTFRLVSMSRAFGDVTVGMAPIGSGLQSRVRSGSAIDGANSGVPANCDCNMMTSPNGNIFRVTGPLCGEFTGHR